MTIQTTAQDSDLFYNPLIQSYLDVSRFLARPWLWQRVQTAMMTPGRPIVLLTAEPGAGKSAFMAWVAANHPNWPRYFIRRDQRTPLEDGGARGFLEKVGFQLAARFPTAFETSAVRLSVAQTVAQVASAGQVVGADIERLVASPFYAKAVDVIQNVQANQGRVLGLRVRELITDPSRISLSDLQRMALLAPALAIQKTNGAEPIVLMIDALDELRYQAAGDTVLDWLIRCPELPANVRILATSRPDRDWLAAFRSAQQDRLVEETIPQAGADIRSDLTEYAGKLVAIPEVAAFLSAHTGVERTAQEASDQFVADAVAKADGNLGYLDALGRAVDQAVERRDQAMLAGLLDLTALPATLGQLFGHFLSLIWQKVQAASIVVKDPRTRQPRYLAQWPALYRPILGILAVAYEMLSAEQLRRLGRIAATPDDVAGAISLLRPFLDSDGSRYRFYHASFPEFLTAATTRADGELARFALDPAEWHAEIVAASTKATRSRVQWRDCGADCDPYVLRHLVSHAQARTAASDGGDRAYWAQAVYALVLDEKFRTAQQRVLGDLTTTLADLRSALRLALERDNLVKALACAGTYRRIKHGLTVTSAIFAAVQAGDLESALQRSRHYEVLPGLHEQWGRGLQLYLAWEAAERGDAAAVRQIMAAARPVSAGQSPWLEGFWDALLARTARAAARAPGSGQTPRQWLAELAPDRDADVLLARFDLAKPDPVNRPALTQRLYEKLAQLQQLVDEGNPEAIASLPSLDVEKVGQGVADLRDLLTALGATPEGQDSMDRALSWLLPDPYPRYRDIGLVAVGIACVAVPDASWTRKRLQDILETALNREGISFTFDLPAVLLEAARARGVPAQALEEYLKAALAASNRWGTAMRAHSAAAAGLFWQGRRDEAFAALAEAGRQDTGLAGYGTVTLLALADRCHEFGDPGRASAPVWGWGNDTDLLRGAATLAARVRDPQFREERIALVEKFLHWRAAATPDSQAALGALAEMTDPGERGLYLDHVTARWANQGDQTGRAAIAQAALAALPDATALDAVLARLFGLSLARLDQAELAEAVRLCADNLLVELPRE